MQTGVLKCLFCCSKIPATYKAYVGLGRKRADALTSVYNRLCSSDVTSLEISFDVATDPVPFCKNCRKELVQLCDLADVRKSVEDKIIQGTSRLRDLVINSLGEGNESVDGKCEWMRKAISGQLDAVDFRDHEKEQLMDDITNNDAACPLPVDLSRIKIEAGEVPQTQVAAEKSVTSDAVEEHLETKYRPPPDPLPVPDCEGLEDAGNSLSTLSFNPVLPGASPISSKEDESLANSPVFETPWNLEQSLLSDSSLRNHAGVTPSPPLQLKRSSVSCDLRGDHSQTFLHFGFEYREAHSYYYECCECKNGCSNPLSSDYYKWSDEKGVRIHIEDEHVQAQCPLCRCQVQWNVFLEHMKDCNGNLAYRAMIQSRLEQTRTNENTSEVLSSEQVHSDQGQEPMSANDADEGQELVVQTPTTTTSKMTPKVLTYRGFTYRATELGYECCLCNNKKRWEFAGVRWKNEKKMKNHLRKYHLLEKKRRLCNHCGLVVNRIRWHMMKCSRKGNHADSRRRKPPTAKSSKEA